MGQVIYLNERRSEHSRSHVVTPPLFFFDVSCPLSYLTAERIERKLGEVEWVPVDGASLRADTAGPQAPAQAPSAHADVHVLRTRADTCARALRLPLVWPDRFPGAARCAQRASAFACEIGAGAAFALAASRLAFCGGFDLEDPETLAEAAAAAGRPARGMPERRRRDVARRGAGGQRRPASRARDQRAPRHPYRGPVVRGRGRTAGGGGADCRARPGPADDRPRLARCAGPRR